MTTYILVYFAGLATGPLVLLLTLFCLHIKDHHPFFNPDEKR